MVVNCNLQRLDGPVRGNGKIIQELERSFRGADWNVIKVIWGGGWDSLLDQDSTGTLHRRMEEALDGDYQMYSVSSGDLQREHWVENNPILRKMMAALTDDELRAIKRGGQDPKKIFAAYDQACRNAQKPTVILIKTVKGDGLGETAQGRNTSHQKKQFSSAERRDCAGRWGIPLSPEQIDRATFYRPAAESPEMRYLLAKRTELGGSLPRRNSAFPPLQAPALAVFKEFLDGSGSREASTTMAFVRMLSRLLKDKSLGRYIVRLSLMKHAPSALTVCSGKLAFIRRLVSSTGRSTPAACSPTGKPKTARSSRRESVKLGRWPLFWRRGQLTPCMGFRPSPFTCSIPCLVSAGRGYDLGLR